MMDTGASLKAKESKAEKEGGKTRTAQPKNESKVEQLSRTL